MSHSELRQDPATKEWVIIAPNRLSRGVVVNAEPGPAHDPNCPLCPRNERMTPKDVLRFPQDPDKIWQVRVVPDKFAAVSPDVDPIKRDGFLRAMDGFGYHEIVIENPEHNTDIPDMPVAHLAEVLRICRTRQRNLSRDKAVRFVTVYRNHGTLAGASLSHPHAQILALPVVPAYAHRKHEIAKLYHGSTQRCLYSEILEAETSSGKRLIEQNKSAIAFVPFAAFVPYEMWIMPQEAQASFSLVSDHELKGLAAVLRRSLTRLKDCCGNVAYSLVIDSCGVGEEAPYYCWHMQITPRLTEPAGIELGSHMFVNPTLPEECAQQLREAASGADTEEPIKTETEVQQKKVG